MILFLCKCLKLMGKILFFPISLTLVILSDIGAFLYDVGYSILTLFRIQPELT